MVMCLFSSSVKGKVLELNVTKCFYLSLTHARCWTVLQALRPRSWHLHFYSVNDHTVLECKSRQNFVPSWFFFFLDYFA